MTIDFDPWILWDSRIEELIVDVVEGNQVDPDLHINKRFLQLVRGFDRYMSRNDPKFVSVFRKD